MGSAFSHRQLETNQPVMQGAHNLEAYGQAANMGAAGKSAKQILGQMTSGDYGGLAGTLLSPIHDQYATQLRELTRNNQMGANAMYQGTQPALMAGLEDETRRKMAEGEGMAYGSAIPQLYGQASGTYQSAKNAMNQQQLAGLQGGLQGRIAGNQYITQPGWMDRLGQVTGIASQIGSMATGMAGLGGMGGGGGQLPTGQPTMRPYVPGQAGSGTFG